MYFLTITRSDNWKETYKPQLTNGTASLPSERWKALPIKKAQYIDFFLDIQQYIVIGIVIPPWKRTVLSPVPFCQRLWGWQRAKEVALPWLVIADCQMLNFYRYTTVQIIYLTLIFAMTLTLDPPEGFRCLPGVFYANRIHPKSSQVNSFLSEHLHCRNGRRETLYNAYIAHWRTIFLKICIFSGFPIRPRRCSGTLFRADSN